MGVPHSDIVCRFLSTTTCGPLEYAPHMLDRRTLWTSTAATAVGGVLGVAIVWLNRPEPPGCTTLDNGIRACMPIYVVGPPVWLYAAFGVLGALLAGGIAYGFVRRARAR